MLTTLILAAVVAGPGTFRIDPGRAHAGFDLKATMHTVHGITKKVQGEVQVTVEPDGALGFNGKIVVEAATLDTDNDRRDTTLRNKTLDVARYPSIVLEPERFVPVGSPPASGPVTGKLTGKITIRGTTQPVSIDAQLEPGTGAAIEVSGAFDVTWADFGIPDPSFGFIRIAKIARANFRATFVPAP
jgi:polyisoprenoid-binding protein YceI